MPKKSNLTYLDLKAEIDKLQAQAEKAKASERTDVLSRIKQAIEVYDFTAADLGLPTKGRKAGAPAKTIKKLGRKPGPKAKAAVKYKDDAGNAWGGRGPRPAWLRKALESGATLESFAVGK